MNPADSNTNPRPSHITRTVLAGSLLAVLAVSAFGLTNVHSDSGNASLHADITNTSSSVTSADIARMHSASSLQAMYNQMISSMRARQGGGMNSSYMQYMQQIMSSAIRASQQSSMSTIDYVHSVQGAQSSRQFSSLRSSIRSSTTASSVRSSVSSVPAPLSSSSTISSIVASSQVSSSKSSLPKEGTYEWFSSSLGAAFPPVPQGMDAETIAALQPTLALLDAPQMQLAQRLMHEITYTPAVQNAVQMFIMGDLPFIHITFAQTNQVFLDFKIANGLALMVQGQVSNPDIDPNDWYAPYVGYVESIGLMRGQANGFFDAGKTMNQAELAKVLASAVTTEELHGAAPQYVGWPVWAQAAIATLKTKNIDVSYFIANPSAPVTRLQMTRAVRAAFLKNADTTGKTVPFFVDTIKLPLALQQDVLTVAALGIMTGNEQAGTFDPYGYLNRAQAAKIFAKALDVMKAAK